MRRLLIAAVLAVCAAMVFVTVDFGGFWTHLKVVVTEFVKKNQEWAPPIVGTLAFGESLAGISFFFPAMGVLIALGAILMAAGVAWKTIALVALAAWVGASSGDWISYWFGRTYGERILAMWPFRNFPHETHTSMHYVKRFGGWAIWIARIFGPVRAFAPVAVGMARMEWLRFQAHNWSSGLVWAVGLLALGYGISQGSEIAHFLERLL